MNKFDVGDTGVVLNGNFFLELLNGGGSEEVDFNRERLLFRGGFKVQFDHLKNLSNYDEYLT